MPALLSIFLVTLGFAAVLALPFRIPSDHPLNLLSFSVEAIGLLALLAVVPLLRDRWPVAARHGVALLAGLIITLSLGDLMTRLALARPLNLYLDVTLLPSVVDLALGGLGPLRGILAVVALVLLPVLAYGLALAAGAAAQRLGRQPGGRVGAMIALALVAGLHLAQERQPDLFHRFWPSSTDIAMATTAQWTQYRAVKASEPLFRAAGRQDALAGIAPEDLLSALKDTDVLVAFIESYGESTLAPPYRPVIAQRLASFEDSVSEAGLKAVSGWLVSSTSGGQSWLAHSSLLSGLTIDSQHLYDMLIGSERRTLAHYFAAAGHRTIDVQPAIVKPWPAGDFFGFDTIYQAGDLSYQGPAFGWVTMPDQYTLSHIERAERSETDRAPLFAQFALISSHAPFTPLAPLVDWDAIGEGAVFHGVEPVGLPSEDVWRDIELLRDHYIRSIDYTLATLEGYAVRHVATKAGRETLLILVGDHQPLPLLAGDTASLAVPVHVISGDPALLKPFREIGFTAGMMPNPASPHLPMAAFRDFFVTAFSAGTGPVLARQERKTPGDMLDGRTRSN